MLKIFTRLSKYCKRLHVESKSETSLLMRKFQVVLRNTWNSVGKQICFLAVLMLFIFPLKGQVSFDTVNLTKITQQISSEINLTGKRYLIIAELGARPSAICMFQKNQLEFETYFFVFDYDGDQIRAKRKIQPQGNALCLFDSISKELDNKYEEPSVRKPDDLYIYYYIQNGQTKFNYYSGSCVYHSMDNYLSRSYTCFFSILDEKKPKWGKITLPSCAYYPVF